MINFQELEKVAEFKNGELNWLEGRDINAVYVILVEDEYYIGSSHYTYLRIVQHLNELLKGEHHSCKFQEKFNKVREFEVYSLGRGIKREDLKKVESYYIKKYNPSLNSKYPPKTKRIKRIKNEEEWSACRKKREYLMTKLFKLGSIDLLSVEDKDEYLRLSESIDDYERTYHPLPGHFSTLLIDEIINKMEENFLTQKELSILLGISESRMSDILNGRRQPNLKLAREIRNKLGISADFILDCYNAK